MKQLKTLTRLTVILLLFIAAPALIAQNLSQNSHFRKPKNRVYVIAHRGAHNDMPENSLIAYQKAIDIGCDFVEIDVRTTKDGKFVSIHNSSVDEYEKGKSGKIKEMTLDQVESVDIGSSVNPAYKNTRIPTFEEILQLCRGKIGIYLDLKDAPVPELIKLIQKYGMEQDIVWYISASETDKIRSVTDLCPECYPMPDPGSSENVNKILDLLHARILSTDMSQLNKKFITDAHQKNAMVFTDDDKETISEWGKIIDMKTDGIQTDKPGELISFLKEHYKNLP
jgi:glycerophosphoryl diester phosphodiesterase